MRIDKNRKVTAADEPMEPEMLEEVDAVDTDLLFEASDVAELLAVGGVFVLMKGQSWPQEEGPLFAEACPAFGFEQVEDIAFSLVPEDPTRHIILAVKKGRGEPKKMRKYLKRT